MARRKKSVDQKMRERRQRLQRKHSDKTVPHGNDNEKDSAADQTLLVEISRTHNRQHTVENENADNNSEEQLQIEKCITSDFSGEKCDRNINGKDVKKTLKVSCDKKVYSANSFADSSLASYEAYVNNNEVEHLFTNIPVSNMSECNEFDPDYNTNCSTTLLTRLKEWTGAIHHPSVHEIHDFDKHFRSWCYNEGQDISSESLTRHCSNKLKCSENRECYTSSKKADVNKFVSIKDSSMVDNTLDVQRDNRSESFLGPNTTPAQRAALNMVDDTYIPDDVIMEAFNIMRRHSPHLAPYIGQLPPAAQHLLRNSNEAALLPYIPQDKFSVNIHHIDSHWITSVFRPQNKTVYIYDSLRRSDRISRIKKDLTILYGNNLNIQYPNVTQQQNMPDCGAFAVAYAFIVLLGIPPETQEYDVNSMRTHLKTILNCGQMIPFPVSIESNCIADYFSTQTKLLSKKQRLLESAKPLLHNTTIMNKKIIKRREYIKAYMCKSRSEESTQKRKDRNQKDKSHKQTLRFKETAQQRQDRNQNS